MDDRPLRQQHPAGVPAVHAGRDAQSASEDTRKLVSPRRDGGLRPSREQSDRAGVFPLGNRTSPLEAYSPHSTASVCQAVLVHETITNCCGDGGRGKPPPPREELMYQKKAGVFMADWWDADGRRHRKQFSTSAAAREHEHRETALAHAERASREMKLAARSGSGRRSSSPKREAASIEPAKGK